MKIKENLYLVSLLFLLTAGLISFSTNDNRILFYTVDTKTQDLKMYWKNDAGENFGSIQHLKNYVENKNQTLIFAMNGGMYMQDLKPLGLFIQKGKTLMSINNGNASGNFYLKPNGVFYITADNKPFVCTTPKFKNNGKIKYATQSGPMLVIDGKIHPAFKEGASNLNIRNGVAILPNNKVVFAMSKTPINFYDFAKFFQKLGCKNALYLDGAISRTYLPEKKWIQTGGDFGVIIGLTQKKNK